MSRSQSVAFRLGGALCVVAVAAFAAALSHLAIDALGDVLLPHDTYDDIAHDSRSVIGVGTAFVFLVAAARSLFVALRAALGQRSASLAFRIASPPRFVGATVAAAVPCVLGMEAIDAALAGRTVDDITDLFGGSLALGVTTTVAVTVLVALGAYALLRLFGAHRERIVEALIGFFTAHANAVRGAFSGRARRRACRFVPAVVLRHAAERGPPLLA